MSSMALEPLHRHILQQSSPKIHPIKPRNALPFSLNFISRPIKIGGSLTFLKPQKSLSVTACSAGSSSPLNTSQDIIYSETFQLTRIEKVEGKIHIRLNQGKDVDHWQLTVGCCLPGKWVLHWGVHYVGDIGSEWNQPPDEMRPPDSIAIKDYAIETPFKKSSASEDGECLYEVNIDFNCHSKVAAINFVLKDEETGSWYQHKGRNFVLPLVENLRDGDNTVGTKRGFDFWPGTFGKLSKVLFKDEGPQTTGEDNVVASTGPIRASKLLEAFYEELPIVKEVPASNSLTVSVIKCPETAKNLVHLETDVPGDVVVHWGVCRDSNKIWEIPADPLPPDTEKFREKALRTRLQIKKDGSGAKGLFTLNKEFLGFAFVLKLNDDTWLNNRGDDYFVPFPGTHIRKDLSNGKEETHIGEDLSNGKEPYISTDENPPSENQEVFQETDEIIKDIRNIVTGISSEKKWKTKDKKAQESILQEIERLAAEAYGIFNRPPTSAEEPVQAAITSATGSGYEILCQGFNWESHKSGRWYLELQEKAAELSELGFTVLWLPPPTESVSPEGYLPKDLYNLNSRYGTIDELKAVVKRFHEVGIKVLGDAVLNHRCAHSQNQNGVWNIFGGKLDWDDRAIVSDDTHFQGRGNKSSGEIFHAAPNIDHSQDFVRQDIKEWMCWLRKDIGFDGWRLDFVRGFWGGYVKDYIDSSEPYFVVGEFWDSLSYTYHEMDYNQDAHRQRIVNWINDTGGTAGAFDVTTKGILHSALERIEYWRLSDKNGKPPGVVGWWPSRAVTFIENHDTGSTQAHWTFPKEKEMQGYAYILTHPGTPSVFYDHIFSHHKSEIAALISLRNRKKIHCRSTVQIAKAENDVYAAVMDDKVAMKIGPGYYEPSGPQTWVMAVEGKDYKVWEAM